MYDSYYCYHCLDVSLLKSGKVKFVVCNKAYTRDACKIYWKWGTIQSCTMLNWMRQWGKSKVSNFRQQSRALLWLLSSVTITTLKCQQRPSLVLHDKTAWRLELHPGPCWGSLQRSPRPPSWWGEPHLCCQPFWPHTSRPLATRFTPPSWIPEYAAVVVYWRICVA